MRKLLIICCTVVFIDATFFAALAPLLPTLSRELDLSTTAAGLLSGSYAAGILMMAIPGGWFAATRGARTAVLVGLIGMGIFSVIFGFARELWLMDAARFCQGASGALMWAGAMSWVITVGPPAKRGTLMGFLVAAATAGELTGAPMGALAHAVGMEIVFGGIGLLSFVLFAAALSIEAPAQSAVQPLRSVLAATRQSDLWPAVWLLAAASFAFGAVVVIAPLRLDLLGAGVATIAAAFACGSIIETLLGPQIGRISDRVGRARPYRAGALLGALAVVIVSQVDLLWAVFCAVILFAFAAGLAFTPSMALAADVAADIGIDQGFASGLTNVGFGGGQMLGAFAAGALAGSDYLVPAVITLGLLLSAALLAGRVAGRESAEPAPLI